MKITNKTIPKGWSIHKIGSLGYTYNGLTGKNKDDFGSGKPYVPYMNIFSDSKINVNKFDLVKIENDDKQNKVKYGDIFLTTSSETPKEVGMSSVLLDEVDEIYLNSFCFGFRLHNFKIILPKFARYLFRSSKARKNISNLAQGSTRFNLTKRFFLNLDLLIPSIQEQNKIAEILSKVDEDIEKTDEIIIKTERLKKGLMGELLSGRVRVPLSFRTERSGKRNPLNMASGKNSNNSYSRDSSLSVGMTKKTELGEIPERWEVVKLEKIAKVERGKFSHRPRNAPQFYNGQYPFIQTGDVVNSNNKITKYKQTLNDKGLKISRIFKKGTIVITIAANIGDTGILEFDSCFPDSLVGITVRGNNDNKFLEYFLRTRKNYLNSIATQSAQKNINLEKLKPLLIIKPPIKEQKQIAEILSSVDDKIEINKLIKNKLTQLKKGLMQDLLSGRVRV